MKILHIIIGLNVGGAEAMLSRLVCSFSESTSNQHIVVSLTSDGVHGSQLRSRGIMVYSLGMHSIFHVPIVFWRLVRILHLVRPGIVQTWMYHGDLLGGLAARITGSCSVVWNVRSTTVSQGVFSGGFWLVRVCAIFSHFVPHRIICCAESAKNAHIKLGYSARKMIVIPNGYDFTAFEYVLTSSLRIRARLGLSGEEIVIGVVGRFDPMKDFKNFVTAASHVAKERSEVRFMMVGRGNEWTNERLRNWIESVGLADKFYLVGQQLDLASYLSAMNIFCLSSVGEAFPNVVVEAMAIGLPCVVTRAGDAADILDDDNFTVPTQDATLLANVLLKMCDLDPRSRTELGENNAMKVKQKYHIEKIRQRYEGVYNEIVHK